MGLGLGLVDELGLGENLGLVLLCLESLKLENLELHHLHLQSVLPLPLLPLPSSPSRCPLPLLLLSLLLSEKHLLLLLLRQKAIIRPVHSSRHRYRLPSLRRGLRLCEILVLAIPVVRLIVVLVILVVLLRGIIPCVRPHSHALLLERVAASRNVERASYGRGVGDGKTRVGSRANAARAQAREERGAVIAVAVVAHGGNEVQMKLRGRM